MKQMRTGILAAAAALAVAAPAAFAADGTITINGQVTSQTCTISGNGGSKDFTVTLPTVAASALATPGATAGRTPFNIALSKCTPNSGNVAVYFEPGATVDTTTGRLVNTAGTGGAGNVQIGLLNSDNSEIRLGGALATQNSKSVALSGGAATLNYYAQYVATDKATSGNVTTSTLYSIVYQ
jgi:major type 1 subunit fimbrin (pilin)